MEQFGYDEATAREEVIANTVPVILSDEAYVKELVRQDWTLAERIVDFLNDFLDTLSQIFNELTRSDSWEQMEAIKGDIDAIRNIAVLFDAALEGAAFEGLETDVGATNGNIRQAVKYDVHNRPFVAVEQDILSGVPKQDWVKTVKRNLATKFPNSIAIGKNTIYINKTSRKEMTFSKYMQWALLHDSAAYADKLRATNNADEIMRASRNFVDEALLHPRKDDIRQFARGDILLRVGNNDYTATVIVGTTKSGNMLLYDIINLNPTTIMERQSKKDTATDQRISEVSRNAVPNSKISQQGTSVNPSIRNNSTENARFSMKDTSKVDVERLAAENESLWEANELLKEQFKLTKGRKVNRKSLERLAGQMLKGYQSQYDKATLTDNLETLFGQIYEATGVDGAWSQFEAAATGLAKAVIEQSTELDDSLYRE